MNYFIILSVLLITNFLLDSSYCDRCCTINLRKLPSYKLSRIGARSDETIISRKIVHNLYECKEFAASRKALAFNFGLNINLNGSIIRNHLRNEASNRNLCQALQCPEIYNSSSLIRDKNYRYYSIYPNYINSGGGTIVCVPEAGLFMLSNNNLNYTQAQMFCQKLNGSLAHVISEERMNGLAKFLSHKIPRYVGLSNNDDEKIWKNSFDEPLLCFEYRAWGTREPSNSRGCVAILTSSSNSSITAFWKVIPCYVSLPYICEIFPQYQ
ncbi:C-type lectin domain family 4 member E-like [Vespa mandarinia]|uniref:C-type lectin domain family 4 member E-like n=1 Tax=Vespa mandarinia TaxID=7446 RepID=UPI00161C2DCC|nr:C-type lectin domain family 4 member E-like [Vespa mandarinia]